MMFNALHGFGTYHTSDDRRITDTSATTNHGESNNANGGFRAGRSSCRLAAGVAAVLGGMGD